MKMYLKLMCLLLSVTLMIGFPLNTHAEIDQPVHWVSNVVEALIKNEIIKTDEILTSDYDTPITRGVFTTWLVRIVTGQEQEFYGKYFSDIEPGSAYYQVTAQARENNLILGFEDGTYRPNDYIQRQDLLTIVGRVLENIDLFPMDSRRIKSMEYEEVHNNSPFADEQQIASYATTYIHTLVSIGVIIGYEDHTIRPEGVITYAETAMIIHRILAMAQASPMLVPEESSLELTSVPIRTPRPIRLPKIDAAPEPIPSPSPTPMKTGAPITGNSTGSMAGSGSGNSSNGFSNGNGNNSHGGSDSGKNNNKNESTSNEYFDENITADIDKLISLKNLYKIQFSSTLPDFIPCLSVVEQKDLGIIVRFLRGLHLETPYIRDSGSAAPFLLDLTYHDNTQIQLAINRDEFYFNGFCYTILNRIEGDRFDAIIGGFLKDMYRNEGLFEISGTVKNPTYKDETTGRYYCDLVGTNMNEVSIDITADSVLYDSRGSGNMMLLPGDEVAVFYKSQGFHAVQAIIITGPQIRYGIDDFMVVDQIIEIQIETLTLADSNKMVYTQPQAIDIFREYMQQLVLSAPCSYEEVSTHFSDVLEQQDAVKIILTYENGIQSEYTLIERYVLINGTYHYILLPHTIFRTFIGDYLSELYILDGMTSISGIFGNPVQKDDPLLDVFELIDEEGNIIEVDITDAKIFDTRINSDKTNLQQVNARIFYNGAGEITATKVILYEADM